MYVEVESNLREEVVWLKKVKKKEEMHKEIKENREKEFTCIEDKWSKKVEECKEDVRVLEG